MEIVELALGFATLRTPAKRPARPPPMATTAALGAMLAKTTDAGTGPPRNDWDWLTPPDCKSTTDRIVLSVREDWDLAIVPSGGLVGPKGIRDLAAHEPHGSAEEHAFPLQALIVIAPVPTLPRLAHEPANVDGLEACHRLDLGDHESIESTDRRGPL